MKFASLIIIPAAPTVIPAKAGIHPPGLTGVLDSGLRRNDGGAGCGNGGGGRVVNGKVWIPAFAGMTVAAGMTMGMAGGGRVVSGEVWIPAFAGMTIRGRE